LKLNKLYFAGKTFLKKSFPRTPFKKLYTIWTDKESADLKEQDFLQRTAVLFLQIRTFSAFYIV
jgi:hypothetical protein